MRTWPPRGLLYIRLTCKGLTLYIRPGDRHSPHGKDGRGECGGGEGGGDRGCGELAGEGRAGRLTSCDLVTGGGYRTLVGIRLGKADGDVQDTVAWGSASHSKGKEYGSGRRGASARCSHCSHYVRDALMFAQS